MKVGGVLDVTWVSVDQRSTSAGGGLGPSRFVGDPAWTKGAVIVITG